MADGNHVGRRVVGAAAAVGAGVAALAIRRALKVLDAADAGRPEQLFTFPSGDVAQVGVDDGGTIVAETAGTGPVVVLVHGITSSRQDWGPVAHLLLERGCTVVGVDQRGHGDSTAGSDGYSAARLGADLAAVLTELDLRDVTLVGHSMGGIAAMLFALDHPAVSVDRVATMVLVATTPRAPRTLRNPPKSVVKRAMGLTRYSPTVARPIAAQALFGRFGSTRLVEAARASGLRADPDEVARCAAGLAAYDIEERLSSIRTPTRCIYGTRDVVTPPPGNRLIARSIPGATRRELAGAGHILIWTHVAELVDEITK